MREIKTYKGGILRTIMVDDADYEVLSSFSFYFKSAGDVYTKSPGYETSLAAFLLGCRAGFLVDHIDRNRLNNQRANLRHATVFEQAANKKRYRNNTTGYKGVRYDRRTGKYQANLKIKGVNFWGSPTFNLLQAAQDYNNLVKQNNIHTELNEIGHTI